MTVDTIEEVALAPAPAGACPYHGVGGDFNPLSSAHLADPYAFYARARREEPVFFSTMLNTWVVSRYDDVSAVLRDPWRFSSAGMIETVIEYTPEARAVMSTGMPFLVHAVINVDPPQHTRIRASVGKAFAARRVAGFEPRVRQVAERLVDQFIDDGRADLVEQFNYPFPATVIFDLIGVPAADLKRVGAWCADVVELLFAQLPPDRQVECAHSAIAYQRYILDLIEQRRAAPQDDLTSDLIRAIDGGEADLSMEELVELLFDLVIAGHETTANLLGNCLYRLLTERRHWRAIQENPRLIRDVVEEAIRIDGPSLGFFRITTEAVELGGVAIPQGAPVFVLFSSANHDEAHFPDPEVFDPHRANVGRHMGFGNGIHFCLGAPLARLEARVALEVLSGRLRGLRLAPNQELSHRPSVTLRGLTHLLVEWDA